ncbi:hypothetical protein [Hahella ganghwensis]|uniref:hypothetical protein n=1 Tax=Hahella ganghwensis TaxID=286420 RepID=UPI00035C5DD2|nr:hypothetical protein [Hahella ganghwensis]
MTLEEARNSYQESLKRIEAQLELFWQTVEKCRAARQAIGYLEAGYAIDNEGFGLSGDTLDAAQANYQQFSRELKDLQARLSETMDKVLSDRIAVAVELMEPEFKARAVLLRQTLVQFRQVNSIWLDLPEILRVLESLLRDQGQEDTPDGLDIAINQYAQYGKELLMQFSHIAKDVEVNLETQERQSVLSFAKAWDVDVESLEGLGAVSIYRLLDGCYRVLNFVSYRTLGELAALCMKVEAAHGIKNEADAIEKDHERPTSKDMEHQNEGAPA